MTTIADIDRLADRIAALVTAQARSSDFWDMYDIAYHLRASKSTVTRWVALPGFPRPIRPPTAGRGLGHPLYLPAEVRKWALGHREGAAGRAGDRERRRHDHPSATPQRQPPKPPPHSISVAVETVRDAVSELLVACICPAEAVK